MNVLSPFASIYGAVVAARNSLYRRGSLRSFLLGGRTVSVGNITTGGTGKTPVAALVAEILADAGEKVCVLTRGYGRKNESERVVVSDLEIVLAEADVGGDEPVELARKLLGRAAVIADADRVAAAAFAREHLGATAFVLDDAFQHRRAERDLDIVCIDASDPFGGGELLPAGRLREPPESLSRAGAIVITRAELAADLASLKHDLRRLAPGAALFVAHGRITGFTPLDAFLANRHDENAPPPLERAFVFCAIGNPSAFVSQITSEDIRVVGQKTFRDHYVYSPADAGVLDRQAQKADAKVLITTAKDAVKLGRLNFKTTCLVAEFAPQIDDLESFRRLVVGGD